MMKLLSVLTFVAINNMKLALSILHCPNEEFTYCSAENYDCTLDGDTTQGFISYGANGIWELIPFTNKGGGSMSFTCDNDFGDVNPGVYKYCCYYAIDLEIEQIAGTIYDEGSYIYLQSTAPDSYSFIEYGANAENFYRVAYGAEVYCSNEDFNDPNYGTYKYCHYEELTSNSSISSYFTEILESTWTYCSHESGACTGISTSSYVPTWVRYGSGGRYYFKLVISTAGAVPCTNGFFEDPYEGVIKSCWYDSADASSLEILFRRLNGIAHYGVRNDVDKEMALGLMIGTIIIFAAICGLVVYYKKKQLEKFEYQLIV